ncbi:uncharacterized protein LOC129567289 isoform X2 [Sitodiplosis mosellana]|uniref:uncharacterized protein LOC129567289 isoform X2 n=1 Tax=Sitodiplosis mosellana TaxID=263140 RepID=UPI0024449355|nr:uncharacterized protein LOC129567289 isoform X2 [Sitodiplosis mosellana]XP_055299979.1 uncharacterized protein LOC129567289 isoform X2 [Sitodiplosis mosellana]
MDDNTTVQLYIYDLTSGMAAMMSQMLLGRHIEGVWHTAIVVYEREFFYGGSGIQSCMPGGTVLGQPTKVEKIGETFIPYQVFKDYLRGLAESSFRGANYNLLKHNCNIFSQELCQFLCGTSIPKYILDLPSNILSTPLGQSLAPLIESIANSASEGGGGFSYEPQIGAREQSPGFDELNSEIEQARLQSIALERSRTAIKEKIAKKEKKKEKKKKKKHLSTSDSESALNMSEIEASETANGGAVASNDIPEEMQPSESRLRQDSQESNEESERSRKPREPAIVFKDIEAAVELENLVRLVDGKLSKDDETAVEELHQYLIEGEGSWALGEGFLLFVGRILEDKGLPVEARVHLLRTLAAAALNDDIILLLHQDRREHILMNFAQDIDRKSPEEQEALALFICNLFENVSSSEWLLYISEWNYNNVQTSNIRASTKVAVHCLLASSATLKDIGTAIVYNLACKEVFDDIAVELTMALLQFFSEKPSEEHLFRTLKALSKFVTVSADIPQLVQMIGPHPKSFKGNSNRCDELIDQISQKVR